MFTVEERDSVRKRLLAFAEEDPAVVGAALTGSYALEGGDEWSDIDLAFAISGDIPRALERWTERIDNAFTVLHHWDLAWRSSVYRVFLLASGLEVDIAFTPQSEFGARGPTWRKVFGDTVELEPTPPESREALVGLGWHHVLHARACIERDKPWQAEWLIAGLRDHVLTLACLRLDLPTHYARGADLLPAELTKPLEATLVRSLDEGELRRALAAAAVAYADELERTDSALAARLRPLLQEVAQEPSASR